MPDKNNYYVKKLINKIKLTNNISAKKVDLIKIQQAIYYIIKYHKHQKRHSGEPYCYHPIEVTNIIMDYIFDTDAIIAALLHDVAEDTIISINHIELVFGKNIAQIVDVVTKITLTYRLSKEEIIYKINSCNDLEKPALIIKIADRLHNMRTIYHINSIDKQKIIAKETLQSYIPLAKYAELDAIANELEILAIKILNL